MKSSMILKTAMGLSLAASVFSSQLLAADACHGYVPQTPRDIDSLTGTNKRFIGKAPAYQQMNLCNIHFHTNAEHKAKDFAIYAGMGAKGKGGGYQCGISQSLTKAELAPVKGDVCKGMKPGDTIEVHWVHSAADITPGPTLGACLSDGVMNPSLRVEAQVFTLVNDKNAMDFEDFAYRGNFVNGHHQAKSIPDNTGMPVEFIGSTTGPSYNNEKCSNIAATWSVRPYCAKLNIHSLAKWCKNNVFNEGHAHGVRELVIDKSMLSEIQ